MNKQLAIRAGWDEHHAMYDTRIKAFFDIIKEEEDERLFSVLEDNKNLRARITFLQEEVGELDNEILRLQEKLDEN